jgi:hypothetical protein
MRTISAGRTFRFLAMAASGMVRRTELNWSVYCRHRGLGDPCFVPTFPARRPTLSQNRAEHFLCNSAAVCANNLLVHLIRLTPFECELDGKLMPFVSFSSPMKRPGPRSNLPI